MIFFSEDKQPPYHQDQNNLYLSFISDNNKAYLDSKLHYLVSQNS